MSTWIIEADGGSRGNPGVAGYGALVRDPEGSLVAERAAPLGRASNNVAEYRGLVAGLEALRDVAALEAGDRVVVRMDSKLVIEQMAGRWKIKHPDMQELARQAQAIVRELRELGVEPEWTWIPRASNGEADRLSNVGMDGETVRRDLAPRQGTSPEQDAATGGEDASDAVAGVTEVEDTTHTPEVPVDTPEHRWQLVLLRHGVTRFTETYRIDGRGGTNPPLSELGLAQADRAARELGERLAEPAAAGRVAVVTSSLQRAQQTGGAVARALGVEPRTEAAFDEQAFGDWDGLTWQEVDARGQGLARSFARERDFVIPGGESHDEVAQRVLEALRAVGHRAAQEELHTVVVAAHRIAIMTVLEAVLGVDYPRSWTLGQDPAAFHTLEVVGSDPVEGFAELSGLNVRHHLHDLPTR